VCINCAIIAIINACLKHFDLHVWYNVNDPRVQNVVPLDSLKACRGIKLKPPRRLPNARARGSLRCVLWGVGARNQGILGEGAVVWQQGVVVAVYLLQGAAALTEVPQRRCARALRARARVAMTAAFSSMLRAGWCPRHGWSQA